MANEPTSSQSGPATRSLERIIEIVFDETATHLSVRRDELRPTTRLIDDLHSDSLDFVDLLMALEDATGVGWPDTPDDPATAAVFTRPGMTLADMAEVLYLRQGLATPGRSRGRFGVGRRSAEAVVDVTPFTQLGGRWVEDRRFDVHEPVQRSHGVVTLARRQRDGMLCQRIPAAHVEFRDAGGLTTGRHIDAFLIDVEPVSTSAYCRFLNSIWPVADRLLAEWFICAPGDDRAAHQLIEKVDAINPWRPVRGCERWPMILVSWYGANAYALWATGRDWYGYRDADPDGTGSALPTEDEWEYAARGPTPRRFPWGEADATPDSCAFARHVRGQTYPTPQSMPIEPVNRPIGLSPFGLRHMAGNVWQWCANEFAPGVRAERGGSWIGPAFLCESAYRRGRVPDARGRCLGFRCVSRD